MTYEEAEKILANDRDYCLKHKRKKIYGAEAIFVDTDPECEACNYERRALRENAIKIIEIAPKGR